MRHVCFMNAVLVCAVAASANASVTSFDDIEFWVGSGENEAALVIDWNDGSDPLAWGFRFDGSATGEDMLAAILTADSNLYVRAGSQLDGSAGGFGPSLYGVGYDRDADGFAISDGTPFDPFGLAVTGSSDGATSVDPDDTYAEGWLSAGYWSYWIGEDPYGTGAWGSASTGVSGRSLEDGAWDGLSFAPGFSSSAPGVAIAAVPAPAAGALAAMACGMAARRRRVAG